MFPIIQLLPTSTHWTAKSERCDRQLGERFGDSAYAAEELIAELGAAFVCAHLGLSTEPRADHAQYINSWLKVLKADKRAIFTAASKAQRAADYLIQQSERSVEVAA
jgi:antirestriction protein ArdC